VQQRISDDHVPGGDVRGAGPLGYAFPTDQPTAVTAVSPTQHGHRVQPVLLTVSAAAAAATGHGAPELCRRYDITIAYCTAEKAIIRYYNNNM